MRRYLFLKSSARPGGNTEAVARLAAAHLPPEAQDWRDLTDPALPVFHDLRHGATYGPPEGVALDLCQATLAATDIVMVAPLYWFSLPTAAKLYLDHWSHWMRLPDLNFKPLMRQKTMWLVMAHASSSPEEIAPAVGTLRLSAEYLGMAWGGALLIDANAPGAWAQDKAAVERAKGFFPA